MSQEQALKDILETVQFLKEHGASKSDLAALEVRMDGKLENLENRLDEKLEKLEMRLDGKLENLEMRLDEKLTMAKSEIMTSVDGFVALHKELDEEQVASVANQDRLDGRLEELAKHTNYRFQDA